jgi:hypothetical protein
MAEKLPSNKHTNNDEKNDERTKYVFTRDERGNIDARIKYVVTRGNAPPFPPGWEPVAGGSDEWLENMCKYFALWGAVGGAKGGKSRSKAKRLASRANGAKGGRPKGSKNKKKGPIS